jgi:starch synthase (maltosyl-transferring)|tara:strand:+ start:10040 stop:12010 length:1971 start_codon:yes stop_codon:yes gene_type:complete
MLKVSHQPSPQRVVIDYVKPSVDGGAFPFKRVLWDRVTFRAAVITDSHDLLTVELRIRKAGSRNWDRLKMGPTGNDEYACEYDLTELGLFEYEVGAGIDHFGSWASGFAKKVDSGTDISVDLLIGAELIKKASARARGDTAKQMSDWADFLSDTERDFDQRLKLIREHSLNELLRSYPDKALEVKSQPGQMLVERERASFSTWYEYFPRSCSNDGVRHGTLQDARSRLGEVSRMGFQVIYFPPIHPIGHVNRKGRNNSLTPTKDDVGSPWAIGSKEGGHKSILPALGTLGDFADLVSDASNHGLEVALDLAFQCAPDHPWVKEHPEWFNWRPDGTVQYAENPPKRYEDILPINFETADYKALWAELKSVFEFWIEQGVTIFRVDNPHTKSMAFWHWCILELKMVHPETIFLAEAFTRPKRKYWLAKAGFTHGYTYFTWRNNPSDLREYIEELTQTEVADYFWPSIWPNTPDILHADLQKGNRATFIGRYVLAATLSSNIGIYGPAYELLDTEPYPGKEEYINNEKYQLKAWDWNAPGNIKAEIAAVNRIRNENRAFQRTQNVSFIDCDNPQIIAYMKQNFDRTNQFIVVVNMDWFNPQSGTLNISLESMGFGPDAEFTITDLLDPSRTSYRWRGTNNFVKLDPAKSPAHIFQVQRH